MRLAAVLFCALALPAVAAPSNQPMEFGRDSFDKPKTDAEKLFEKLVQPGWSETPGGADLSDGEKIVGLVRHRYNPERSAWEWIAALTDFDLAEYYSIGFYPTLDAGKDAVEHVLSIKP